MKLYPLILLLLCLGCRTLDKKIIRESISVEQPFAYAPPTQSAEAYLSEQIYPQPDLDPRHAIARTSSTRIPALVLPNQITWSWNPGDYTNFVVIESVDLQNWDTYVTTSDTMFSIANTKDQQFFTLYGTNSDGDSAWVINQ